MRSLGDRVRAVGLALTTRVGATLMGRLLAHFGSLSAIFAANDLELRDVPGIGPQIAASIRAIDLERVAAEMAQFDRDGIQIVLATDEAYPEELKALPDYPLVLFMRGILLPADRYPIAIVGTRQPTAAALKQTTQWATELSQRGYTIVSGLARGIDTQAHWGALNAPRTAGGIGPILPIGRTIAVLGSGVRNIYPPENRTLAAHICGRGALVCEVHPDANVTPNALVLRNRLITALSRAVVVMECGVDSGAMDAARRAHAQGRPVFTPLPSPGLASPGVTQLLADFARPLPSTVDDFLAQLGASSS